MGRIGRLSPVQRQSGAIHAGGSGDRHPGDARAADAADHRVGEEAVLVARGVARRGATRGHRPAGRRDAAQGRPVERPRGAILLRRGVGISRRREAAEPLGRAARNKPAFRVSALSALAVLGDPAAAEQLHNLLEAAGAKLATAPSAPSGSPTPATRSSRANNSAASSAITCWTSPGADDPRYAEYSAEVVLFGRQQAFSTPLSINAGNQIMITSSPTAKSPSASSALTTRPKANRFQQGGRRDSGDRRTRRNVSQRRSGDPGGQSAGPCPAASRLKPCPRRPKVPAAHGRRGQQQCAAGEGKPAAAGLGRRQDGGQVVHLLQ